MEEYAGFLAGIGGIIVAIAGILRNWKYMEIIRVFVEAVNDLDKVLGEESRRKTKQAVRRKSLVFGIEEQVHKAVKRAEKKR